MCDTPYGATTVARVTASGSSDEESVTIYSPADDGYYLVFGHITSDTASLIVRWTDWESNAKEDDSSGGVLPLSAMRVKGGTNIIYQISGSDDEVWSIDIVLVKL